MKKQYEIMMVILIVLFGMMLSAGFTIGILKLICFCFGLNYSAKVAFGIWLVLVLINGININIRRSN